MMESPGGPFVWKLNPKLEKRRAVRIKKMQFDRMIT
jgi:hypothetical protein